MPVEAPTLPYESADTSSSILGCCSHTGTPTEPHKKPQTSGTRRVVVVFNQTDVFHKNPMPMGNFFQIDVGKIC
jgi:hypothetical protein